MKYILLFGAGLCFSVFSYAQNVRVAPSENKLNVTLLKDSLFVTDKSLLVPVANIRALDSLLKRLPQPETLTIEFETRDADKEQIRAVEAVLKQCRCHIRTHSIRSPKQ